MNACKLCGEPNITKPNSHIIPSFFYRWIKETSPTGYLRAVDNPNKSLQDGLKCEFLCETCEKVFNKWETKFSNKVFYPLTTGVLDSISEDDFLLDFVASIAWRALAYLNDRQTITEINNEESKEISKAIDTWSNYLLGKTNDITGNDVYLIPVKSYFDNIDKEYQSYNRSVGLDFRIFDDHYWGFVYVKLPNMIIIGHVLGEPEKSVNQYKVGKNYVVNDKDTLEIPDLIMRVINKSLSDFNKSLEKISPKQIAKIEQRVKSKNRNPRGRFF